MIELPSGVDINNLIDDIRILSWQAADILLYYSKLLEDSDGKRNILKNNNENDPVTLADLKVNELIIKRINEKYKNINWDILSEENVKISSKTFEEIFTFSSLKIPQLMFLYFSFILLITNSLTFKSANVTGSFSLLFFNILVLPSESSNKLE